MTHTSAAGAAWGEGAAVVTTRPGGASGSALAHDLEQLLRDLVEDAQGPRVLELVSRITAGLDETDEEVLGKVRERALTLRAQVSASRWRESQLQRMLDTAQELMSGEAPEQLLGVVIHAARQLVPSDIVHINLAEPGSPDFHQIRATEGEVTEAWRRYRSRPGVGVTGQVFATNAPFVAVDYATEPGMLHDARADEAATSDGVHTMAGVPIRRGNVVIGALIASWRSRHQVSAEQLSTMSALASLASVSLESARSRGERVAALAALEESNRQLLHTNAVLEWGSSFHDRLTHLILEGAEVDAVARAIGSGLGCRAAVLDGMGAVLATTDDGYPRWPGDEVRAPSVTGEVVTGEGAAWMATATSRGAHLASVVVDRVDLTDMEKRTLDRVAVASALLLTSARATFESEARAQAATVAELVAGTDHARAVRHSRATGLRIADGVVVVTLSHDRDDDRLLSSLHAYAQRMGGMAGHPDGSPTLVLPGHDAAGVARAVRAHLGASRTDVTIGADGPVSSGEGVAQAFTRARSCCLAARRLGTPDGIATPASLGFAGLLLAGPHEGSVADFVDRTIGPVLRYDARRASDLVATMTAYYAAGSSLRDTAARLHVHPNTIHQRLRRVATLLEVDLTDAETALQVQLALRLWAVGQGATPAPA